MVEAYSGNRVCLLGDMKKDLIDDATQKYREYKNKQMILSVDKLQYAIEILKASPSKYYGVDIGCLE